MRNKFKQTKERMVIQMNLQGIDWRRIDCSVNRIMVHDIIATYLSKINGPRESVFFSVSVIGRAKRSSYWGVQSRFRVIYIYIYISLDL